MNGVRIGIRKTGNEPRRTLLVVMNKKVEWEYRCPNLFNQFHCDELSSVKSEPAFGVRIEGDAH
jgi:hypothetical protein